VLDTSYISENESNGGPGNYFDRNNNWRVRSNLMARWTKGDWGATWFTRYFSRQEEACPFYYNDYGFGELCNDAITDANGINQAGSQNKMGGTTYHDLSVFWKAPWNGKITIGVNNVFAKDPPVSFTTFANSFDPSYEIPGRFVYMQYNQKF
jgi:iron complex outermembrane receptor protein